MGFFNYVALTLFLPFAALFITGIYNRYFHALSKYPGPFWGSVTDFYKFYMITSVPTLGLELHKKHGSWYDVSTSKHVLTICSRANRPSGTKSAIVQ